MNPYPALSDALVSEHRPDADRGHFPSTLVAANGSLVCTTDYLLCVALAREVMETL